MVFIARNTKHRYKYLILRNHVCPNIDHVTLRVLWCVIHNYIILIKYTINFLEVQELLYALNETKHQLVSMQVK